MMIPIEIFGGRDAWSMKISSKTDMPSLFIWHDAIPTVMCKATILEKMSSNFLSSSIAENTFITVKMKKNSFSEDS